MSIHEDIQRLAAHLTQEPADPDALERMQRLIERVRAGSTSDAQFRTACDAIASAHNAREQLHRLEERLSAAQWQHDATHLFAVWLDQTPPSSECPEDHFPRDYHTPRSSEHDDLKRIWRRLTLDIARLSHVDLGNHWPRELNVRYRIQTTPETRIQYSFVGPFNAVGRPLDNIRLDINRKPLIEIIVGDVTVMNHELLDTLRDTLETPCEARSILTLLLIAAEGRSSGRKSGFAIISDILRAVMP